MKSRPVVAITVVVLLACAALWAVRYVERMPRERLAALLGVTLTVGTPTNTASPLPPIPSPVPLSDRLPALSVGTVAVQSYSGSVQVRSGSGTVVSGDGLILTTAAVAPWGSGSYAYRVVLPSGQALAARRVASDAPAGLVLLKADAQDLAVVAFSDIALRAGDELWAVGASSVRSAYVPQVLEATVVSAPDTATAALSLDREHLARFAGARMVDRQARSVGILRPGSPSGVISAAAINDFIARTLAR